MVKKTTETATKVGSDLLSYTTTAGGVALISADLYTGGKVSELTEVAKKGWASMSSYGSSWFG